MSAILATFSKLLESVKLGFLQYSNSLRNEICRFWSHSPLEIVSFLNKKYPGHRLHPNEIPGVF